MKRGDDTRAAIIEHTIKLLAKDGPPSVSLRRLGQDVGIAQSAAYHHFANKEALLSAAFYHMAATLGVRVRELPPAPTFRGLLAQRIAFQFDNAPLIVAMLKYFMAERRQFRELDLGGYVPPQAYRHISEVIERGNVEGAWNIPRITDDAKVIVHAINGFVLEYYPDMPSAADRAELLGSIEDFIWRALTNPHR